jgi:polyhydroxybutyrate depolymerase
MRLLWGVVGAAVVLLACSSDSTSGTTPENPEGGTSSSGGSTSSGGSSGASSGTPPDNDFVTTTTETLQHQGAAREYILSIPKDYDAGKKYPLWVWLHGEPGDAKSGSAFALHNITKNEAIIAYPGAIEQSWDHTATFADNADDTFIFAMIDAIAAKYSADKARVLLDGWSNGGFMAAAVACRASAKLRAIGIHAGGAPYDANNPDSVPDCAGAAVATFVSHGRADTTVPFDGGEFAAQYWSEHNGCGATKTASPPAPCESYDGCPADKPVKACFIEGLGHPVWDQALSAEWAWFKSLP